MEDCFKFLWPIQNIWTLPSRVNLDVLRVCINKFVLLKQMIHHGEAPLSGSELLADLGTLTCKNSGCLKLGLSNHVSRIFDTCIVSWILNSAQTPILSGLHIIWIFKKRKESNFPTVYCSRAQLRWSTSLRSHQNLLREFGGIAFLLLWERNVTDYHNGFVSYLKAHSKLYIPSTINIWKMVLTKAIWPDKKWAGFWQISL